MSVNALNVQTISVTAKDGKIAGKLGSISIEKTSPQENAWAATVTTKGQVTIPADLREALKIDAGDRLEFVRLDDGRIMIAVANKSVTCLKGRLKKREKPVTVEEMNEAIAAAATGEE